MSDAMKPTRTPPYLLWRHPPGCPDSDWCAGNGVCYWHCDDDCSDDDCAALSAASTGADDAG